MASEPGKIRQISELEASLVYRQSKYQNSHGYTEETLPHKKKKEKGGIEEGKETQFKDAELNENEYMSSCHTQTYGI